MTELVAARRAEAAPPAQLTSAAAGWAALLVTQAALAATTNNPLVVACQAAAVVAAGSLLGGPRRAAHRQLIGLGLLAWLWWVALTLLLPGPHGGTVLLDRPSWGPAPGVTFGGPLTSHGIAVAMTSGARAFVGLGLLGVALHAVPGEQWIRLARACLGRCSGIVEPWCRLGDALTAAWTRAGNSLAQGWRAPLLTRWGDAFRLAAAAPPLPDDGGRGGSVAMRVLRVGAGALLVALPVLTLAGVLPGAVTARLSPFALALGVVFIVLVAANRSARPVALIGLAALAAWLAGPWLPAAALTWSPSDGWPPVALTWVVVALLLPVAAALEGGDRA